MLLRAYATHPLERDAQREGAAVAHPVGDGFDGGVRPTQAVGGEGEAPDGQVSHRRLPHQLGEAARESPVPEAEWLAGLFTTLLDGHNASTTDGAKRVLGREPRDFAAFARHAAAAGAWQGGL